MKQAFIYILLISFAYSCSSPVISVIIDNPTEKEIKVKFDGMEPIIIIPFQPKRIDLESGHRTIIVNDQKEEKIELDGEMEYLINPLKETYYIETRKYFVSDRERVIYYKNNPREKTIIKGEEYNIDAIAIENQLLIPKNWQFGVREGFKPKGRLKKYTKSKYVNARKIHRKSELEIKLIMYKELITE